MSIDEEFWDICHSQECPQCNEKQDTLDEIKYWLQVVVNQMYEPKFFNEKFFEEDLSILCNFIKVKMPEGTLQIARKEQPKKAEIHQLIPHWLQFNKQYLESLK